ncbi:MAG: ribose 5-phosphate isomerase A [Candidatus Diapherotrites archaeon]
MEESHIEQLILRYIKDGYVVSIGSNSIGEKFLKKLALAIEDANIDINSIEFVPTSMKNATIASSLGLSIADLNEREVDVAIDFADQIDINYNFLKRHSHSFIRDKMIAQSAATLIVIAEEKAMVDKIKGSVPFEVCTFGWKRTLTQLDSYGKATRREIRGLPFKTETGNYVIDVRFDKIFSYEDLEIQSKNLPGVIETGLFLGYADKIILHGKKLQLLSRPGS